MPLTCLPFGSPVLRTGATLRLDASTVPNTGTQYFTTVSSGPTATGPWTVVTPKLSNFTTNDPAGFNITGGDPAAFANFAVPAHNTTLFYQTELFDGLTAALLQTLVCGPVTTGDYPTAVCDPTTPPHYIAGPLGKTENAWTLSGLFTGGTLNGDDTIAVNYGTVPGGPYPNVAGGTSLNVPQLTGLTPNTTYYYRVKLSEVHESNAVYSTSVECSFTTFPGPPALTRTKTSTPATATVGQPITSTVTLTNSGQAAAFGVQFADPLPSNVLTRTWSLTTSGGAVSSAAPNPTSGTGAITGHTWDFPVGASVVYTVVDAKSNPTPYTNTAQTSAVPQLGNTVVLSDFSGPTIQEPVAATPTSTGAELVKLCTQVSTVGGYCIAGAPVLLHVVASSDGDIIPVNSIEFPAPAGHGVFTTMGFFRSYYADLSGGLVIGLPSACATAPVLVANPIHWVTTAPCGCFEGKNWHDNTTGALVKTTDLAGVVTVPTAAVREGPCPTFTLPDVNRAVCINHVSGVQWNAIERTRFLICGQTTVTYLDPDVSPMAAIPAASVLSVANAGQCCCLTTPPPPSANLSITKSVTPSIASTGQPVTFDLLATNNGPSAANGATITDVLPAGFTGNFPNYTYTGGASGGTNTFPGLTIATFPSGATVAVSVTGTFPTPGTYNNTATIAPPAGLVDPVLGDNSAGPVSVVVSAPTADVSIVKSVSPSNATVGQTVTYTLVVANAGPNQADGTSVTDNLPPNFAATGISFQYTGGATNAVANLPDFFLNTFPAGSTVTILITGSFTLAGTFNNTATVTAPSGTTDPNLANNTSSTVPITVA